MFSAASFVRLCEIAVAVSVTIFFPVSTASFPAEVNKFPQKPFGNFDNPNAANAIADNFPQCFPKKLSSGIFSLILFFTSFALLVNKETPQFNAFFPSHHAPAPSARLPSPFTTLSLVLVFLFVKKSPINFVPSFRTLPVSLNT